MNRLIECVPNYSEGRDKSVIDAIVNAISSVRVSTQSGEESVKILNVDSGEAANRTVVTFVGSPEAVVEAAFDGSRKASELIDMRLHHGVHPRSGAIDVLPLVPIAGVSLEECAEMARALAERMYTELGIPCYCYEASAFRPDRRKLEACRAGEYESLPEKIADSERRPDFGPSEYNETVARTGASNVGARKYLIAVNFNLDTAAVDVAKDIAAEVRESGRKGSGIPGTLKGCKAIGWYIEEYGVAQVSMNITDIDETPLHKAYEEVCRAASTRGVRVTGTEIIGLVPKRVLLEAGQFYAAKIGMASGLSEEELVATAIREMRLDDLCPFEPAKKVIEYPMR